MLFSDWQTIFRTLGVGFLAYTSLILILRVSGKRTLSKMNAFDLVVTVALGSTLATILLSRDVSLAEGVAALGLLVFLQYGISWLSVRVEWFQSAVKATPSLLVYQGRLLEETMKRERISGEEIYAALRSSGHSSLDVSAVVLETDGTLSVLGSKQRDDGAALAHVKRATCPGRGAGE